MAIVDTLSCFEGCEPGLNLFMFFSPPTPLPGQIPSIARRLSHAQSYHSNHFPRSSTCTPTVAKFAKLSCLLRRGTRCRRLSSTQDAVEYSAWAEGKEIRRTVGNDKKWSTVIGAGWKRGDGHGVDAGCGCVEASSEEERSW